MTQPANRGFVLMAALFLIVTFAAIGLYLVTVSMGQIEAVTQDEQAARAYQAARAGIEWGAFQVLRNVDVPPAAVSDFGPTCKTSNSATQTLTFGSLATGSLGAPAGADLFRSTVTCSRTTESEAGNTVQIYVITSTGCNRAACTASGDSTYVERQLQLVLSN